MKNLWLLACLFGLISACTPSSKEKPSTSSVATATPVANTSKKTAKEKESSENDNDEDVIRDPFEEWNRSVFAFNTMMDDALIIPLLSIYDFVIPEKIKTGIHNVLNNIGEPISIINSILQANPAKVFDHLVRFMINTVFGLGGWFDVAAECHLEYESEDFGKTLRYVFNLPPGYFFMLPIIGPTTTIDSIGQIADFFAYRLMGISYGVDFLQYPIEYVDLRLKYLHSQSQIKENFSDPYVIIRGAYYEARGDLTTEDDNGILSTASNMGDEEASDEKDSILKDSESDEDEDIFSTAEAEEDSTGASTNALTGDPTPADEENKKDKSFDLEEETVLKLEDESLETESITEGDSNLFPGIEDADVLDTMPGGAP